MSGVNKVILIGNLGSDPELRHTPSGTPVANFRMATNEFYSNRDGQREQRTEWHRIVAFGRLAEVCGQYLKKGKQIYVEGRIQTRSWEDQTGNQRFTTEIICNQMVMLGRAGEEVYVPDEAQAGPPAEEEASAVREEGEVSVAREEEEDLPF